MMASNSTVCSQAVKTPCKQPLRIVQIVRSALYGGVENHVYELCRNFKQSGSNVTLVSLVDCEANRAFLDLGIEIVRLNDSMHWSWRIIRSFFALRGVLKRLNPDVIHLHGVRATLIGSLAAKCSRVPGTRAIVISTLHGSYSLMAMEEDGSRNPGILICAKLFHWLGFALSDRVVVDCMSLTEEVREVYRGLALCVDDIIKRKVRTIYNAIDLRPFGSLGEQRDIRPVVGIPKGFLVIGTISRLDEPKKGLGVFLRAARIVLDRYPDVHFVVCGDGYGRGQLETLTRTLRMEDSIHFLGYWENALEVYKLLDVFVLPSFSEGFPTVNLEAMAAGLPVVTTDVGGASEAVVDAETGFVVPPRNDEVLAVAMLRMCESESIRSSFGVRGKSRVHDMFCSDTLARNMMTLYNEMIRGRFGPSGCAR